MGKLETYQAYADKCAERLNIDCKPVLRWQTKECRLHSTSYAHCHLIDDHEPPAAPFPRGTVCLSCKRMPAMSIKQWHHTIAHEVAHLAVKSAHHTPTFDRRLVALGVANDRERLNARSARKGHRHIWMSGKDRQGYFKKCHACQKRVYRAKSKALERHNGIPE